MKRAKKILKWTGIVLLTVIIAVSALTASRQNLTFDAPYPAVHASTDTAVIARGRHLVRSIAHCADCHSPYNTDSLLALGKEAPLIGGKVFDFGLGKFYSRNLTPDLVTGIGKRTDEEIARTLYYGVYPNGNAVLDFMPFHNVSESDMSAIISYLRTLQPVRNIVPQNDYNVMGKVVKAFMVKPVGPTGAIVKNVTPDTTANYGKYLVLNLGNCAGCHTRRGMAGEPIGELLAGGNPMEDKDTPPLVPPNLTPDSSSRIFGWDKQRFINRFKKGKIISYSHMPWNSFKQLTNDELTAIYNYLQTVKPAKTFTEKNNSQF